MGVTDRQELFVNMNALIREGYLVSCSECHHGFRWQTARASGLNNYFATVSWATRGDMEWTTSEDGVRHGSHVPPTLPDVRQRIEDDGKAVEHLTTLFFADERQTCKVCAGTGVRFTRKGALVAQFVTFVQSKDGLALADNDTRRSRLPVMD